MTRLKFCHSDLRGHKRVFHPGYTRASIQGSGHSHLALITILAVQLSKSTDCTSVRWSGFLGLVVILPDLPVSLSLRFSILCAGNHYPCFLVLESAFRLKAPPLSVSSYRRLSTSPTRLMQDSQAVSPALVLQCEHQASSRSQYPARACRSTSTRMEQQLSSARF